MLILGYLDYFDEVQVLLAWSAVLSHSFIISLHLQRNLNELLYDQDKELNFNCERRELVK